jgi:hypothetical protein
MAILGCRGARIIQYDAAEPKICSLRTWLSFGRIMTYQFTNPPRRPERCLRSAIGPVGATNAVRKVSWQAL